MIKKNAFIIGQACYIIIVLLALLLLPGVDVVTSLVAFIGVWAVISHIYQLMPWKNQTGAWTLLIVTTILSIGIIANVHLFTTLSGGTTELPILHNTDAARTYYDALHSYGHEIGYPAQMKQHGYGLIASWIWHLTGVSIVPLLIINMFFILLCIILSGGISRNILYSDYNSQKHIATCAMIMTSAVCYYINSGTLLLKEASLCLALCLTGFSITALFRHKIPLKQSYKYFFAFLIGIIIIAFFRYYYLLMVVLGIVIFVKFDKQHLTQSAILLAMCIVTWLITSHIHLQNDFNPNDFTFDIINGESITNSYFFDHPQHRAYNNIVDGYLLFPWWKKLLYLPLSATVQFLAPLPWNFDIYNDFGYTQAYARIGYPWYLIGGLLLYFLLFACKKSPQPLKRCFLWGSFMWLIPAYLVAGTVSRYALPFIPMLIPAAVYIWHNYSHKKSLYLWSGIYCILLIIALFSAHNIQQSGIQ